MKRIIYFGLGLLTGACAVTMYFSHKEKLAFVNSDAVHNWSLHHADIFLPEDSVSYYKYHEYPPNPNGQNQAEN